MRITERRRAIVVENHKRIEERDLMNRQLRRAKARNEKMFNQGFNAAVRMVEAGADLERLRAAKGAFYEAYDDTQPYVKNEFEEVPDTDVDMVPLT